MSASKTIKPGQEIEEENEQKFVAGHSYALSGFIKRRDWCTKHKDEGYMMLDGDKKVKCSELLRLDKFEDTYLAQMRNPWGQSEFLGTFRVDDNSGRFVMTKDEFF